MMDIEFIATISGDKQSAMFDSCSRSYWRGGSAKGAELSEGEGLVGALRLGQLCPLF